mgnify:CR=1 FL=1
MTKGEVAHRLFDLVSQADTTAPNAPTKRGVLEVCNAAVQEISHYATRDFWRDTRSAILHPPTTVTLNVTEDSKTIASLSTWAAWMEGCSIEIAGSDQLHRLDGQTRLQEEWIGSTASGVTATVYGDAVKLNGTVLKVLGSIVLDDERVLTPLANEDRNNRLHHNRSAYYRGRWWEYGESAHYPSSLNDKTGTPTHYFIDSEYEANTSPSAGGSADDQVRAQENFLRVRPFPEAKSRIRFSASIKPTAWTLAEIELSGANPSTAGNQNTGCPGGLDETILLPFCYQNMTKMLAFMVGPLQHDESAATTSILTQIYQDYEEAILILQDLAPQSERTPAYQVSW